MQAKLEDSVLTLDTDFDYVDDDCSEDEAHVGRKSSQSRRQNSQVSRKSTTISGPAVTRGSFSPTRLRHESAQNNVITSEEDEEGRGLPPVERNAVSAGQTMDQSMLAKPPMSSGISSGSSLSSGVDKALLGKQQQQPPSASQKKSRGVQRRMPTNWPDSVEIEHEVGVASAKRFATGEILAAPIFGLNNQAYTNSGCRVGAPGPVNGPPRAANKYNEAPPLNIVPGMANNPTNFQNMIPGAFINQQQMAYQPLGEDQVKNAGHLQDSAFEASRSSAYQVFENDKLSPLPKIPSMMGASEHGKFPQRGGDYNVSIRSEFSVRTQIQGSVVSFHDIKYEVREKKMPWSKPVPKSILNGVSGLMRPGLNAIMGPTGSGKSSLLDVLAGRKDPRFLKGHVLIDSKPQPKNFKCMSGYVVQDDIVMGTLTVRENLFFSAALRLPAKFNSKYRKEKVEQVIEELGLVNVADSKIGTELIRGVSGGERKRCNIGMELITDPTVLFLDEPTTGLDAYTAGQVIKTLKNLSRRGRTIIFSLHQPKYSIYKLFDTLTLVCQGNIVYHGSAAKHAIRYFNRLGYYCEEHDNPTDFFMDILHDEARMINSDTNRGEDVDVEMETHETIIHDSTLQKAKLQKVSSKLTNDWRESPEGRRVKDDVDRVEQEYQRSSSENNHHSSSSSSASDVSFNSSFFHQLRWVCWRTGLNLLRDPNASIVQTVVYFIFAISMGIVYFKLDSSLESGYQNRAGLFFFSALQVIFVNLGSIEMFIKERVIFIHENSSGYYRVSSYFFAKILCDILPTKALPILLFMLIPYFMAALRLDAGAYFFFILILVMTTLDAAGIALLISASVTLFSIANVIVSICYVFMMVFGGYLINLNSMGVWLSWLRYLSIFRYCWSGLLVNELPGMNFCPTTNLTTTTGQPDNRTCVAGTQYLKDVAVPYGTGWDLWMNFFGLFCLCLVFYTICYVQLRRINKYK